VTPAGTITLAGDIGGTNTRLALFHGDTDGPQHVTTYESGAHAGLDEIVADFLATHPAQPASACFGIAGPVRDGRCAATNLAWQIDAAQLAERLEISTVRLINDLEANGYGIASLGADDFEVLNEGDPQARGNAAVISAGTGLGEAGMYWDGERHRPFACEGGHVDFAPRSPIELGLHEYLLDKFAHASYERACSGMGLANIYRYLGGPETEPAAISEAALDGSDERAVTALDVMVSIYGAAAGNLALKMMAVGGIYVGGGIAPKILPKLRDGTFMRAFVDKGRFASLLERVPVRVILNDKTALIGAARCGAEAAGTDGIG
jgi:glucokinase